MPHPAIAIAKTNATTAIVPTAMMIVAIDLDHETRDESEADQETGRKMVGGTGRTGIGMVNEAREMHVIERGGIGRGAGAGVGVGIRERGRVRPTLIPCSLQYDL